MEHGKYDVDLELSPRMCQSSTGNGQRDRLTDDREGSHGSIDEIPISAGVNADEMDPMTGGEQ